ncbi:hypothetical protein GGS23DRAFT_226899 [Durotheca rogersii]|uniref:uncharacterized protein n=1 Tax=Durotheca rogersii TaxID=419775 RepID=UPI00221F717B|nr:uncharacterized protein GGS23DRAFT_226899 [Durotheca rogersii]KAI5860510.1 hypothetical protein GGS23DRAFT_226899 [Durotheca rogersii]
MAPNKKKRQPKVTFDDPISPSPRSTGRSTSSVKGSGRQTRSQARALLSESKLQASSATSQGNASAEKLPLASSAGSTSKVDDGGQAPAGTAPLGGAPDLIIEEYMGDDEAPEDNNTSQVEPTRSSAITPVSMLRRRTAKVKLSANSANTGNNEDDDDAEPVATPHSNRRKRRAAVEPSQDEEESPVKARKTAEKTTPARPPPGLVRGRLSPRTRSARRAALSAKNPSSSRGHRSRKQKNLELIRRRRAGEKITDVTESEPSSDEQKRKPALFDSDSEADLHVLTVFHDEEPDVEPPEPQSAPDDAQQNANADVEDDLDGFITHDSNALLGAPADIDIPLQFTSQAHMPLRVQFTHVVEWLVQNKVNPVFDRRDELYLNAWRKLGDEFIALASSKFSSAAWKPQFYLSLKARPTMEVLDVSESGSDATMCEACGRSGHPAKFEIQFSGQPYYKDTLTEIESDSEEEGNSGHESVDSNGEVLPSARTRWRVGAVCCSNAETAHSLLHWKHALKEQVEEQLRNDGWMAPDKLKERERMKSKARRRLADSITDSWDHFEGFIPKLFFKFKKTLEDARNKNTTGRGYNWGR